MHDEDKMSNPSDSSHSHGHQSLSTGPSGLTSKTTSKDNRLGPVSGGVSKPQARTSLRVRTTQLRTADAANFRAMIQEYSGLSNSSLSSDLKTGFSNSSLSSDLTDQSQESAMPESWLSLGGGKVPKNEDSHQELKDASDKRLETQVRLTIQTRLEDDGYMWRKYGQKDILGSKYPRSYYRCSNKYDQGCRATKQIQRSLEDPKLFEATYKGRHTCTQAPMSSIENLNMRSEEEEKSNEDLYAVLGVEKGCSMTQLRSAYKKLRMRWHLDRYSGLGNSELLEEVKEKFKAVQHAYSVLSDANKRDLYDAGVYDSDDDGTGTGDIMDDMAATMGQSKESAMAESSLSLGGGKVPKNEDSHQELKDAYDKRLETQIRVTSQTSLEDDGYSWRKYGEKDILGSETSRSYYRCNNKCNQGCKVKKRVQRSIKDPKLFEVTYAGRHTCTQAPKFSIENLNMRSEEEEKINEDLYAVLGVEKGCSMTQLQTAYKKLRMRWHPGQYSGLGKSELLEEAKEKFEAVHYAYSVLSDANKRDLYDAGVYDSDDDGTGTGDIMDDMAATMSQSKDWQDNSEDIFQGKLQERAFSSPATSDSSFLSWLENTEPDYDVFVSFMGEDTRNNFTSHLYASLWRKGIRVFQDGDKIFRSKHHTLEAIQKSRVSIIIVSENYAYSAMCLDELVKIMECRQKNNQVVFPVFYHVSPTDLTNRSGSISGMQENRGYWGCAGRERRWSTALKLTTLIPGYVLADRLESELIDEIVRNVCKTLSSSGCKKLIGIDSRVEELLSLLSMQSQDVRSVGIWGMGGIGKTTIAREIWNRISSEYEGCYFLEDFHEQVQKKGLDHLRDALFSQIFDVEGLIDVKPSFMKTRLQHKRVFIIFDDVNDSRDVESLVGKLHGFGEGSRVIITSRDKRALLQCKVNVIYEVNALTIDESLQLFCQNAFEKNQPEEEYRKQTTEIVNFVNGIPLALQFLGSSLKGRTKQEWDMMLQRLGQDTPNEIQDVFRKSYYGLDDNEQNIFLDIACFFRGECKDDVARLLDGCGFFAHLGITGLVDKSLITILGNRVEIPDLIQQMGRELVCKEERADPGKRSRLWNPDDISYVLTKNTGTEAVQGIFLDTSKLRLDLSPSTFSRMYNLRLLKFCSSSNPKDCKVHLPHGLEHLPDELRLLHWESYPLKSLPRSFCPKNLVELNLPYSHIEKLWKGSKSLEKLKKIRLSHCKLLTKIPRLSKARNLEHIDLEGCKSLVKVTLSIRYLDKLTFLNLKGCSKLNSLPSMAHLESLEVLNLSGCSELEQFPEISPNVRELYIGGTAIRDLPPSIQHLPKLVKLDLENSGRLENIPTSICKLKHLEELNLSGCSSLESFPDLPKTMKSLRVLDLSKTAIKEVPSSILQLIGLQELRLVKCENLKKLPDNLWNLRCLSKVEFNDTDADMIPCSDRDLVGLENFSSSRFEDQASAGLLLCLFSGLHSLASRLYSLVTLCLWNAQVSDIPEDLCYAPSLKTADLSVNDFQKIPTSIRNLSKLETLCLSSCKQLRSLPELPRSLAYLDAHSCTSLETTLWNSEQGLMGSIISSCLLNLEIPGQKLRSALIRIRRSEKQEFQEFFKSPSLTICFPANALPDLLTHISEGSSAHLVLASSWWKHNLLGFVFLTVVAFEKNFCNDCGLAIRCICSMKTKNGKCQRTERIFKCWSQNEGEPKIQGGHTCIFYDYSMHECLAEEHDGPSSNIEVSFDFFPVDQGNKLLPGCRVRNCAVYMLTAQRGINRGILTTKRPVSSSHPGLSPLNMQQ